MRNLRTRRNDAVLSVALRFASVKGDLKTLQSTKDQNLGGGWRANFVAVEWILPENPIRRPRKSQSEALPTQALPAITYMHGNEGNAWCDYLDGKGTLAETNG